MGKKKKEQRQWALARLEAAELDLAAAHRDLDALIEERSQQGLVIENLRRELAARRTEMDQVAKDLVLLASMIDPLRRGINEVMERALDFAGYHPPDSPPDTTRPPETVI